MGIGVNDENMCQFMLGELCSKGSLPCLLQSKTLHLDESFKNSLVMDLVSVRMLMWGQSGAFLEAWCHSSRTNIFSTWHGERHFSIFVLLLWGFELTFGRCKNSKPVVHFLPGFLPLRRNVWVVAIQNGSTTNFKMKFFGDLTKTVAILNFLFSTILFSATETASEPRNVGFGMG